MITWAGIWVALAAFSFGHAVLALVLKLGPGAPRSGLERHGLALLLGLATLPAIWVAAIAMAGPLPDVVGRGLLAGAVLSGAPALILSRRHRAESTETTAPPARWSIAAALGTGLIFVWCAFAVFTTSTMPMHVFDPLYHFAYKGSLLYHEGFGTPSWMVIPEGAAGFEHYGRPITHPSYPPGIPALHAMVGQARGQFDRDATRFLMALYLLIPAALIWSRLRGRSLGAAVTGTLLWVSLPFFYFTKTPAGYLSWGETERSYFAGWIFSPSFFLEALTGLFTGRGRFPDGWTLDGAADLPLAAFLLGSFLCLLRSLGPRGGRADIALGGLLLGGLLLTKNEGTALAAVLLTVLGGACLFGPRSAGLVQRIRGIGGLTLALALGLALCTPWLLLRGAIPTIDEDYPRAIAGVLGLGEPPPGAGELNQIPRNLDEAAARVPVVLGTFGTMSVGFLRWGLLWFAALLAPLVYALTHLRRAHRHESWPILGCVLGVAGLYALVLVVTPWDLAVLANTLIPDRLMLHVAPLAVLAATEFTFLRARERQAVAPATEPAS